MITPSYGLTATERVLPSFTLDWTTGAVQSTVDVTRSGVATFVGSNGLIQSAAENTQRVDYSTGVSGILVEESRTNIASYSEDQDTAWTGKTNSAITSDQATAPDNSNNGDLFLANSTVTTSARDLRRNITATVSVVHSFSIFTKKASADFVQLTFRNQAAAGNSCQAEFNINTGAISMAATNSGNATGATAKIEDYGNGWYRCTISGTADNSGTSLTCIVTGRVNSNSNSVPADTELCYLWGAQLEAGAFPTSYIPTEASAVTRNADKPLVNDISWFNPNQGTFLVEIDGIDQSIILMAFDDGTNANRFTLERNTSSTVRAQIASSNTVRYGPTLPFQNISKLGLAYSDTVNSIFSVNGTNSTSGSATPLPTVTNLHFGTRSTDRNFMANARFRKFMYYPQRLTDAEIRAFTK